MINEIFEFLGLSDKTIAEIVTWIIGTVTGGATILNGIKRKRTKTPKIKISDYFRDTETPLRSYTEYFIPNHLRIEEAGEMCSDNSINDLIKQELNKKGAKLYLLEASTGVGKTTYMVNLFLTLTKQIDPLAYLQLTANKKGIGYWCIWLGLHVWSAILGLLSIFGKNKTAHVILVRFNDLIADEKNLLQTYIDKKKASNTTVLIDAMDEYSPIVGSSDTEYWDKFKKDWETIAEALTHFKTSVISLREQFLKEKETTIGTIPCYRIKLLPFKKSQVDRYNAQRYENNVKVKHFFDRIDLLQEDKDNKLPSKSQTIHNIPLILSRAEDIVAHREEILKDDYSYYAILKVIVKEWLNREREKNNITKSIDKDNIEIFCQTIAYKLATQDSFSAGIPEDALTDMDISKDLRERIFGNRERTLLHRNKEVYSSQNIKTEVYHYRFVHRAFLEFFLVELALRDEEKEKEIPFGRFDLAEKMFIQQRWKEKKVSFPKIDDTQVYKDRLPSLKVDLDIIKVDFLKVCHQFFISFSNNLTIREKLKSSKQEEGLYLLEGKPLNSIDEFKGLQNMVICNANFWDDRESRSFPEVQELIPYIKSLISVVHLTFIEKLEDKHLQCFSGIKSLETLFLSNNNLDGSCLKYFANSKNTLIEFFICRNKITDDRMFEPFDGASSLQILDLSNNSLDGSCLKYFANSKNTLKGFTIYRNKITDDRMFEPFDGASSLQLLDLGNNSLDGSCLKYFANSKNALVMFVIHSNRITEDRMFEPFDRAGSLQTLELSNNSLNGSCLQYFSNSKYTLCNIFIEKNNITNPHILEPLYGANRLKELSLENNPIGDNIVWDYIKASKDTLKECWVSLDGESRNIAKEITQKWNSE